MSTLTSYNGLLVVTPDPTGGGGLAINNNFKALSTHVDTMNPTAANDVSQGFVAGSRWYNSSTGVESICLNNASGAAVWAAVTASYLPLGGGSMSGNIDLDSNLINFDAYSSQSAFGVSVNMDGGRTWSIFDNFGYPRLTVQYWGVYTNGNPLYLGGGTITMGGGDVLGVGTFTSTYWSPTGLGTPTNTVTPVAWLAVGVGGSNYYVPLYQ